MSIMSRYRWSGRPSSAWWASTIIPAHVPRNAPPRACRSRMGCSRSYASISFDIVEDSPPGITRPSSPSRSRGSRTSTASTPTSRSAAMCSRNAPWRARTPTLPATRLQQALLAELRDLGSVHGVAEPERDLRDDVRVGELGRRPHDGGGHRGRVGALEDAGADEEAVRAELHHQGRV